VLGIRRRPCVERVQKCCDQEIPVDWSGQIHFEYAHVELRAENHVARSIESRRSCDQAPTDRLFAEDHVIWPYGRRARIHIFDRLSQRERRDRRKQRERAARELRAKENGHGQLSAFGRREDDRALLRAGLGQPPQDLHGRRAGAEEVDVAPDQIARELATYQWNGDHDGHLIAATTETRPSPSPAVH
jgi:hypothetical protein